MAWVLDTQNFTKNLNNAREMLADNLYAAGVITKKQADVIANDYAFVVVEKGMFGKLFDKFWGEDKTTPIIKLVKTNLTRNYMHSSTTQQEEKKECSLTLPLQSNKDGYEE